MDTKLAYPELAASVAEVEMARMRAQAAISAVFNRTSVLTPTQPAAATASFSTVVTRRGSGIFRIWATLTAGGGTTVAGDGVTFQLLRTAAPIGSIWVTGAVTATGATPVIAASGMCMAIDNPGIAIGGVVTYSMQVTNNNGHTIAIVAINDGEIITEELVA